MNIHDILFASINIKFVDKNDKILFDDSNISYYMYYVKIGLSVYISSNYNVYNINKVKIIDNNRSKIVLKKIYYIIPKNKKQNTFNYIKYYIKNLLK
jgi:hypothetical protein